MSGDTESLLQWTKSLLNEKRHSDVIFEIGRKKNLYAHKIILERASPVFKEMFNTSEGKTEQISLTCFGRESVMNMLRFVHLYEVNLHDNDIETVFETLKLAKMYKLMGGLQLENACIERLKSIEVSVDSVCHLLQYAIKDSNGGHLAAKCWSLVDREASRVFKTDSFKKLELSVLEQVLGRDNLQCTEIEVFDAAIAWAKEKCRTVGCNPNPEQLREQLDSAFFKIRFPLMTFMEFKNGPKKVIFFKDCETNILYEYYLNRSDNCIDQSNTPKPFSHTPRVMVAVREENEPDSTEQSTAPSSSCILSNGASPYTRTKSAKKRKKTAASSTSVGNKKSCQATDPVSPVGMLAPKWFSETFPQRSPYFPQIGDEIVYYRQGHKCYVEAVQRENVYSVSKSIERDFPYVRCPDLPTSMEARVLKIDFVLKPYPLICVDLEEINTVNENPPRRKRPPFKVQYHDMDNEVDFMILRQVHERGNRNWAPKKKFRTLIGKEWICGVVNLKKPYDEDFEDSEFLCYVVKYYTSDKNVPKCTTLNAWDMEKIPESFENRVKESKDGFVLATEGELRTHAHYTPSEADWRPYARDTVCKKLRALISELMLQPFASHFSAPIDLNQYPEYSKRVAYPMDLSLIQKRLENLFYRRIDAVKFDLEFLVKNAEMYKPGDAEYIKNAKKTRDECLKLIEKPDTQPEFRSCRQ